MKQATKRILSILAAAALTVGAVPQSAPLSLLPSVLTASAADSVIDSLTWQKNGTENGIIITGYTGEDTALVIPDQIDNLPVTEIGSQAFKGKNSLVSITLPDTVTEIGFMAFSQCEGLKEINMPASLKTIGNTAFASCSALEAIEIPDGVTSIGNGAFSTCPTLASVTIPETVTSIGESAFRDTAWLTAKRNENPLVIVNHILIDGAACSGDVVFPDGAAVTRINDQAFYNNSTMTGITLPDTVAFIGNQAFMSCTALKSITIPDSVTETGSSLFYNCSELEDVTLSDSLTKLESGLFTGCSKLSSVKLPARLTKIPAGLFQNCENLKDITIPETVEVIDALAFMNCTGLESIILPKNLARIERYAFRSCTALKSAVFLNPDTVINGNQPSFSMCSNVTFYGQAGSTAEAYAQSNDYPFIESAAFSDVSLTLSDDLGLNFFAAGVTAENKGDYKVVFSGKCEEAGKDTAFTEKAGLYCASANVSADHMDEAITAKLYKKAESEWTMVDTYTYSVNQYLDSVDTVNPYLTALVETTRNYGKVSKAYFTDPENMPAVSDHSATYYTEDFKPVKNSDDTISLVLNSRLAARLYVKDLPEDAEATCGSAALTARKSSSGQYFFEVTGITPTGLAEEIVIRYGESEYRFSPLSWSYLAAKNGNTGKNKAMADILCEYYINAKAYADTL